MVTLIRDESAQTAATTLYIFGESGVFILDPHHDLNVIDYRMGTGNDTVNIYSLALTTPGNSLTINAGAGFDNLSANLSGAVSGLAVTNASVTGDGLALTNFERYGTLTLGTYNDTVTLVGRTHDGNLDGGAGRDSLSLDNSALSAPAGLSLTTVYNGLGEACGFYGLYGIGTFFFGFEALNLRFGSGDDTVSLVYETSPVPDISVVLDGGGGQDRISLTFVDERAMDLTLTGPDLTLGYVALTGFEAFTISGRNGNDRMVTGGGNDILYGGGGSDTLTGGAGDDLLDGTDSGYPYVAGADLLTGGLGNDTYWIDNPGDKVVERSGEGVDTVISRISYSLAGKAVENLTLMNADAVDGTGNSLGNVLSGNFMANHLNGLGGHDRLNGGQGLDTLAGGTGNDTYVIDTFDGVDAVIELEGEGLDTVISSMAFVLSSDVENLILTGSGNGTGNDRNNVLTGSWAENVLTGGLGNDTYYIQNTADNVVEANGQGTDTVFSTVTYNLNGRYVETLHLTGAADINATGNSFANTLIGNDGMNTLNGKAGADRLSGGLGADIFLFQAGSGKDVITDFNASHNDSINIHAYTGGIANAGLVTQHSSYVAISLNADTVIKLLNSVRADVLAHIVW